MIKELPLYLQPGGYVGRQQKKANNLKKTSNWWANWAKKHSTETTNADGNTEITYNWFGKTLSKFSENAAAKSQEIQTAINNGEAAKIGSQRAKRAEKAGQIASATASGLATAANATTAIATSQMDIANDSSFHSAQQLGQGLSAFGPYGALLGAAITGANAIYEGSDIGTSQISKSQAEAAGLSGWDRISNNIAGIFAPSMKKTNDAMQKTAEAQAVSGAYADAISDIDAASSMGGKGYLFGRNNINNLIAEANRKNATLTEIGRVNTLRKQSDYGQDLAAQNQRIYAGSNYAQSAVGKKGMKIASVDDIKKILELRKQDEDIQSFQNGGIIGIDVNVIPEGKYHAHKNHLDELNEDYEDLTKKGIPVIVHSEGGELEQIAEIEKMELIFRLEVTEKLEELFKDGSDEAMIEAGKLVAVEIMENTQDNSGEVLNG